MDCGQVKKMFEQFIMGDLSQDLRSAAEEHFRSCGNCQEEFHQLQNLYSLLAFPEEIKAPENFTLNIMKQVKRIKGKESNSSFSYRAWGTSLIAAAIVMLMLNAAGLNGELNVHKVLEKSTMLQRSITLSVDETSKTILQLFDSILK